MPAYIWSCLACGNENAQDIHECATCACPSNATFKEIVKSREEFVARGGIVLASAGTLPNEGDYAIMEGIVKGIGKLMALFLFFGAQ
jgi:hypothetical protein